MTDRPQDSTTRSPAPGTRDELAGRYRRLLDTVPDAILMRDVDSGAILDANEAAVWLYGYEMETLLTLRLDDLEHRDEGRTYEPQLVKGEGRGHVPLATHRRRDGGTFPVEIRTHSFPSANGTIAYDLVRDLSRSRSLEATLHEQRDLVAELQRRLEQKEAAMLELLHQLRLEKARIEQQVRDNVATLVLPHLGRAKARVPPKARADLELAETSLLALTSPVGESLATLELVLSPRELEICGLIATGQRTKDVAQTLDISTESVGVHRRNIRRKLGLTGRKTNLTTYLAGLRPHAVR